VTIGYIYSFRYNAGIGRSDRRTEFAITVSRSACTAGWHSIKTSHLLHDRWWYCWAEYRTSVRQTVMSMISRDQNGYGSKSDATRTVMFLSEYFHQHNAACLIVRSPCYVLLTPLIINVQFLCLQRWESVNGTFMLPGKQSLASNLCVWTITRLSTL